MPLTNRSERDCKYMKRDRNNRKGDGKDKNLPKCMGVEHLCEGTTMQIPFINADEINLIYQFGEQGKAKTCADLSAILPQVKDNDTKQIINSTLKKLNALSEETCAELTATTIR